MSRRFSKVVPKSELELERFYLDTINKLEGTTTTLSDEEQKSSIPLVGMVHDLKREIVSLSRDTRNMKAELAALARVQHENRTLRAKIYNLEKRIENIEGEL